MAVTIKSAALNAGIMTLILGHFWLDVDIPSRAIRLSKLSGPCPQAVKSAKFASEKIVFSQFRRNSLSLKFRPHGRQILAAAKHRSGCSPKRKIASSIRDLASASFRFLLILHISARLKPKHLRKAEAHSQGHGLRKAPVTNFHS